MLLYRFVIGILSFIILAILFVFYTVEAQYKATAAEKATEIALLQQTKYELQNQLAKETERADAAETQTKTESIDWKSRFASFYTAICPTGDGMRYYSLSIPNYKEECKKVESYNLI